MPALFFVGWVAGCVTRSPWRQALWHCGRWALGLLCLAASPALAQDPVNLDAVRVTGRAVRTDVRQTCPDIQGSLTSSLARAYSEYGREGFYTVGFTLTDGRVSQVKTQGGDPAYKRDIRRAMSHLDCRDPQSGGTPQNFAFMLQIRHDD